jgi:hypothetical protein
VKYPQFSAPAESLKKNLQLELELIQTQMAQKPMMRAEMYKGAFGFRYSGKTPVGSTTGLSCFLAPRFFFDSDSVKPLNLRNKPLRRPMGPFFAQKAIQHTPEGTFAIPGASEEKLDAKKNEAKHTNFCHFTLRAG